MHEEMEHDLRDDREMRYVQERSKNDTRMNIPVRGLAVILSLLVLTLARISRSTITPAVNWECLYPMERANSHNHDLHRLPDISHTILMWKQDYGLKMIGLNMSGAHIPQRIQKVIRQSRCQSFPFRDFRTICALDHLLGYLEKFKVLDRSRRDYEKTNMAVQIVFSLRTM
jgi:hypothetical protein